VRIFWKQLLLHLGILIVTFVLLGFLLVNSINNLFIEQRVEELTNLAHRMSANVERFTALADVGILNPAPMINEMRNLHQYLDAVIILLDAQLNILQYQGVPDGTFFDVPGIELLPLLDGEIITVFGTNLHPSLSPLLIVGYPFYFNGEVAGASLVGIFMADLENTIDEMLRIIVFSLVIAGFFAAILVYFTSRRISKPLRQINNAAVEITDGDLNKRININRKDEVGQLASQFNKMAETLSEQERIRREFIANLSHDIRSPLTSMRGFLTAISDGTIPPDMQPHYLNIVKDESERIIKLSNEMLDLHTIQSAEIELARTTFDINDCLRKAIMSFERRAVEKKLMIHSHFAHAADIVWADEDKVFRCVYNLIDNAVKFTPEDGEITIETTTRDDVVTVSVADNGPGMDADEQKRVFDRFYKSDPSRGVDKMGSGLGLSIVREFIKAHGENINVHSEPGKGTTFEFTLPLMR